MKFSTAAFTASALALASLVTGQSTATINTPTQLFTCEPAAISASTRSLSPRCMHPALITLRARAASVAAEFPARARARG